MPVRPGKVVKEPARERIMAFAPPGKSREGRFSPRERGRPGRPGRRCLLTRSIVRCGNLQQFLKSAPIRRFEGSSQAGKAECPQPKNAMYAGRCSRQGGSLWRVALRRASVSCTTCRPRVQSFPFRILACCRAACGLLSLATPRLAATARWFGGAAIPLESNSSSRPRLFREPYDIGGAM